MQRDVLRRHPGFELAVHVDAPHFQRGKRERLRREHVAHLRCSDAERDRAERAVRRRVRISAGDRLARLRDALFRPDDVNDALAPRIRIEKSDTVFAAVLPKLRNHRLRDFVRERLRDARRGNDVIDRRERALRVRHRQIQFPQHAERLGRRDFMNVVHGDEELRLPVGKLRDRRFTHRSGILKSAAAFPRGKKSVPASRAA